MKGLLMLMLLVKCCWAQTNNHLRSKVTVAYNVNLETYFFAEKLAVERINDFVFDHKDWNYAHQPIVYYGYLQFKNHANDSTVLRIAQLIKQVKDTYQDNSPIMDYLVNQKEFPATGPLYNSPLVDGDGNHPEMTQVLAELTDSLRKFYYQANVALFLEQNKAFYQGTIAEVTKDVDVASFPALEKWYGKKFPAYKIFVVPSMPITAGADNYRGTSPRIVSPQGFIPSIVMSSNRMLPMQNSLRAYKKFGFDNPEVTHLLTKHEIGHTFVNPEVEKLADQIKKDSALFTVALQKSLAPHYINNWYICVVEHLVRLGEIRTAVAMGNSKEAKRLRKVHIGEYKCVLLPLLETQAKKYEANRQHYHNFKQYLPKMLAYLHSLTPVIIDQQVKKYDELKE
ncbi:DUF4932 domain-containing protein [Mucilaginibacter terrenus]|uniref:DUF4932 domain-containing protein n=1 Tax=Mucilaginibacter terrenus TaxID=2482727 RepID=A0A3E2NK52_9SPHI|nr:DUF4932 domain-containing protein [Mucilaginibacter terrenus]RFZ81379.1 DUF4932 domain-containing protein [Mucilaginibacter terrenus]